MCSRYTKISGFGTQNHFGWYTKLVLSLETGVFVTNFFVYRSVVVFVCEVGTQNDFAVHKTRCTKPVSFDFNHFNTIFGFVYRFAGVEFSFVDQMGLVLCTGSGGASCTKSGAVCVRGRGRFRVPGRGRFCVPGRGRLCVSGSGRQTAPGSRLEGNRGGKPWPLLAPPEAAPLIQRNLAQPSSSTQLGCPAELNQPTEVSFPPSEARGPRSPPHNDI